MAIDEGITTLESLSGKKPSQSLRPEPRKKARKVEERFGNVTDYRLMWTGGYMEGVVSDSDAHLPFEKREKMLIPRIVKAPFEHHINDKGDLKIYFDKGFVLLEDAPQKIKDMWEKAKARDLTPPGTITPLTPEIWEAEQARRKGEKEEIVKEKTTQQRTAGGQFKKRNS